MVFPLTPGTEVPAELNAHFPGHGALCTAQDATHKLHDLLTLSGAEVRDPRVWAGVPHRGSELRRGSVGTPTGTASPDILAVLILDRPFDALAIRVDGPHSRAATSP
jgi:alkyl sulfatase BDS1-like metallo-beta-lactamase superfamily hydrolase